MTLNITADVTTEEPVTILNFGNRLESLLARFQHAKLTTDLCAQIHLAVSNLCIAVLHGMDWVPGDIAEFWDITVASTEDNRISVDIVPTMLKGKDVRYETDSNEPGVTAVLGRYSVTASTPVAAQIALARVVSISEQAGFGIDPEGKELRIPEELKAQPTPAETADDKFVLAWDGMASEMYNAYGDSVGFKNFSGGPMPQWNELPRRIRAAWCFSAAKATNYIDEQANGGDPL